MCRMISSFYASFIGCWGSSSSAKLNITDDFKFNLSITFLHKDMYDPNGEVSGFGRPLPCRPIDRSHGPFEFSGYIVIINDRMAVLCFDAKSVKSMKSIQKTERARKIYT